MVEAHAHLNGRFGAKTGSRRSPTCASAQRRKRSSDRTPRDGPRVPTSIGADEEFYLFGYRSLSAGTAHAGSVICSAPIHPNKTADRQPPDRTGCGELFGGQHGRAG